MEALGKPLDRLGLISCLNRPVSFVGRFGVRHPLRILFIDILGLEYLLIDPRIIPIIFLMLLLNDLIVFLIPAQQIGLAVLLLDLCVDFFEDYGFLLQQQVDDIGLVDLIPIQGDPLG